MELDTWSNVRREWRSVVEFEEIELPLSLVLHEGKLDLNKQLSDVAFATRVRNGQLVLQARGLVGWVPVNRLLGLDIRARVPIRHLDRLLTLGGAAPMSLASLLRRYGASSHRHASLRDIVTETFLEDVRVIEEQGLLRLYESRGGTSSSPKGRVVVGNTAREHWARGRRDRVVTSWFERTLDVGPNQVIRLSLELLAQSYRGERTGSARRKLRELSTAARYFEGANPSFRSLADPLVRDTGRLPAGRGYYAPAVELARFVAGGQSPTVSTRGDDVELPSLLFRLDDAFETYCRNTLATGLGALSPRVVVHNGFDASPRGARKPLFDEPPSPDASPDIVVSEVGGVARPVVLFEVKYMDRRFSRSEIEQAIAYAASYRAPVVLVRPRLSTDSGPHLEPLGSINDLTVLQYTFDLAAAEFDEEEARLVEVARGYLSPRLEL